jgi:hypothetical protein
MSKSAHGRIFMLAMLVWAGFWVAGLPSYNQQYSTAFMVWFEVILFLALVRFVYSGLKNLVRRSLAAGVGGRVGVPSRIGAKLHTTPLLAACG